MLAQFEGHDAAAAAAAADTVVAVADIDLCIGSGPGKELRRLVEQGTGCLDVLTITILLLRVVVTRTLVVRHFVTRIDSYWAKEIAENQSAQRRLCTP